jgi:hypothetical protein
MPTTTSKRNLPRDLFLHLLAMVTLYWSAISFVTLLWQYINYFFPDALDYYVAGLSGSMRFAIASLIIVFPVFLLSSWYLNTIYKKESAVRESKIRKWLIYITLFVASLTIIGDLVAVINTFLGGEITARFILKALSILVVATFVLGYYFDDVRKPAPTKLAKPFAIISGVLILIAVIGAFFIVGSPKTARELQFDSQRTQDLQTIQSQVVSYWQSKSALPTQLSDLNNAISGFSVPMDPETNTSYEYTLTDAKGLSFELCSTFDLASNAAMPAAPISYPGSTNDTWTHPAGHFCFTRTIDKQLYPPITK